MASFETFVRPTVLPNIRPAPAQPLPGPASGSYAVIRGNGAKTATLSHSWSSSASTSTRQEKKRRFDTARVYQKEDGGTVNRDNFIDIEVPTKIWMSGGGGTVTGAQKVAQTTEGWKFTGLKEAENIEIKKRDQIRNA